MQRHKYASRRGFTAVEALIVIAIIGVALGLTIPAVLRARESSNRVRCGNNLKQIGMAFHTHIDTYGVLPTNGAPPRGRGLDRFSLPGTDGVPFFPTSTYFLPQETVIMLMSAGDPSKGPSAQTGSWGYAILPYIEQGDVHRRRDWTAAISVYACRSRRSAEARVAQNDRFGNYAGGGWRWGKSDYAVYYHPFIGGRPARPLAVVTDGTSSTVLVGEKVLSPEVYTSGSWFFDEPYFFSNTYGSRRMGNLVLRDAADLDYLDLDNWGAAHISGAQFVFVDGSVHLIRYGTSPAIVQALLTPHGGESTPEL